ncbi:MAG: dethiobiotin synthase [Gammaproteobacteria bacterium]|nr:dethiobiotin synthase [Gammaproteobacteria bacterium]
MTNIFITGTDTGVGKTWGTLALMAAWQARGLVVNGMKPVASGSEWHSGRLENEDARLIHAQCSLPVGYEQVNPYALAEPIAPHIAAAKTGIKVELDTLVAAYRGLTAGADRVVVEGVGGWRVPLAEGLQTEALVRRLDLTVVLVVGLRLGCINHALLTMEAISAAGVPCAGWLGNGICRDYAEQQATLDYLRDQLSAPCLGVMPWLAHFDAQQAGALIALE